MAHKDCTLLHFQNMTNNKKTKPLVKKIRAAGFGGLVLIQSVPSGPFWSCQFAHECMASPVPVRANGKPLPRSKHAEAAGWKIIIVDGTGPRRRGTANSVRAGRQQP